MLTETQRTTLKMKERKLLNGIRKAFSERVRIIEKIKHNTLFLHIPNPETKNFLELFYQKDLMVLTVGKWCHAHPESVEEAIKLIKRIIDDKVIIWKVKRPNGHWYSGFYDVDEYEENIEDVDEPDTGIEKGDKIVKSTFSKIIEDRVVE